MASFTIDDASSWLASFLGFVINFFRSPSLPGFLAGSKLHASCFLLVYTLRLSNNAALAGVSGVYSSWL